MVFSEIFFTGMYTTVCALILAIANQCYKSKCKEVEFCCIKIIRDVDIEENIDRPTSATL